VSDTTNGTHGSRTAIRTCPLCEATCGLQLTLRGRTVTEVRGDPDDVFSRGYICPKGAAFGELEADPDRVRTPLIKRNGSHVPATWQEAFEEIGRRLPPILEAHGRDSVGVYLGNPNVHNLAGTIYGRVLVTALGSRNLFTASTVDQMPRQVAGGLMFGTGLSIPIPDIDRTDHLLILGANPFASNGSLLTAPDIPGRLRAIRRRGGRIVVVDPRRTRTAKESDEHLFIVPGTDALFLFSIVHTLFDEGLVSPGRLLGFTNGIEQVRASAAAFPPERTAQATGIDAATTRRVARELAAAERAAVYARIGTCTQEFGTLASWLVDVVNVLTGNLDRPGGALFTKPAAGSPTTSGIPGRGKGLSIGRRHSRVRGLPEVMGELPVVCLAEEIETPGEGQIRALITVAGNPVLSTPDSGRTDAALGSLDFMVSVDIYLNETTRHADVILPGQSALTRGHYDLAFYVLACRNIANYSPPVQPLGADEVPEHEVLLRLAAIAAGQPADIDIDPLDEMVAREALRRGVTNPQSPAHEADPEEIWEAVAHRRGPERVLDILLRTGPYSLTLEELERNPHGVDLGPLEPRLPEVLKTPSGRIELMPEPIERDIPRLLSALDRRRDGELVLIGRRHVRSNNSWMHNVGSLNRGSNRCTLLVHPEDATRLGLVDGGAALVGSEAGRIEATVEVCDELMPGVVSLPHGWGHAGTPGRVQSARPGVNSNVLARTDLIDPLSGNAVLNGIPVTVAPVMAPV